MFVENSFAYKISLQCMQTYFELNGELLKFGVQREQINAKINFGKCNTVELLRISASK